MNIYASFDNIYHTNIYIYVFSLLLPFCMIEHDFMPIQENDEEKFSHQKMTILLYTIEKISNFSFLDHFVKVEQR